MSILKIKSQIATKEFTLDYDELKNKYYLSVCAYGDLWKESFFGDWALKEYLRDNWDFSELQINELLATV